MSREVWGTYSVKDHLNANAFLADLMLYDRLVLPIPEEQLDEKAKAAWQKWNAPLQKAFVDVLERYDRVRTIPWRVGQWDEDKEAFAKKIADRPGIDRGGPAGRQGRLSVHAHEIGRGAATACSGRNDGANDSSPGECCSRPRFST
jgi:hypothetical protein